MVGFPVIHGKYMLTHLTIVPILHAYCFYYKE